jgi:hypothetical protein
MNKPLGPLDELTLKHLQAAGANLDKATEVNNYIFFKKDKEAAKAASRLAEDGYKVRGPSATKEGPLLVATTELVPSPENIASLRTAMEAIAKDFHGDYDGWEAAVTT